MSPPLVYPGPCAKRKVVCILVTVNGEWIKGENDCANPQPVCPREEGEDYTKCQTICRQGAHAEVDAVRRAGDKAIGAKAYLINHTYACRDCQETLFKAGVSSLSLGPPPESNSNSGSSQHLCSACKCSREGGWWLA